MAQVNNLLAENRTTDRSNTNNVPAPRRKRKQNRRSALQRILVLPSPVLVLLLFVALLGSANSLSYPTRTRTRTRTRRAAPLASNDAAAAAGVVLPSPPSVVIRIPEAIWREAASDHRNRIRSLLEPGLVGWDHPLMAAVSASRKRKRNQKNRDNDRAKQKKHATANANPTGTVSDDSEEEDPTAMPMTMLDPKHPIYNFLVEYYGLKGLKGPKRLARWSPGIGMFFVDVQGVGADGDTDSDSETTTTTTRSSTGTTVVRMIRTLDDYYLATEACAAVTAEMLSSSPSFGDRGVFLEGATPDDFGEILHLKDAEWIDPNANDNADNTDNHDYDCYGGYQGILYRPHRTSRDPTGLLWYRSILDTTLNNEPILHCYGLHEWAMQYHPEGAPPPPSGKYQAHLPLRVSRDTINETVERRGVSCTHVDALRFFAPAAAPLNHHGASLARTDQLKLEQPACVHAHMDLLKIALKLVPYCDPALLGDVLEVALEARTLDVGASPYDPAAYESEARPIPIVPVESSSGRVLYKKRQAALMEAARPIRIRLRDNMSAVLRLLHSDDQLEEAEAHPSDERFATATPGGKPWRKSLTDRPIEANE